MVDVIELETDRLKMRQWKKDDRPLFAALNADPVVMEYFPAVLDKSESNAMAERIQQLISRRGWGFWAVEEKTSHAFIGFVGLHVPTAELPCSPCIEIGWRLMREFWGKGYATEAARAALQVAFKQLDIEEVFAFTPVGNARSRAVMERLHMENTQQNFEHPAIPEGHLLREHVLYRLSWERWHDWRKINNED
ncbi:MAG TPA: N-acetyltransferase [Desulfobulbaceae bacterium]|nr:N-acetyltransferase [Desulfobulbaceae bacterium]